jgi:CHASE3 domain sensor protein
MKSIKLKNPYLIGSLLSSVILLALIVFFSNVKEKNISANLVEHSNKVIKRSNDLFLDLIQHQTGIRGYMITNDTSFLQPYTNSLPNIKKHFKELRNLTKENQLQQHWLDSLENINKTKN